MKSIKSIGRWPSKLLHPECLSPTPIKRSFHWMTHRSVSSCCFHDLAREIHYFSPCIQICLNCLENASRSVSEGSIGEGMQWCKGNHSSIMHIDTKVEWKNTEGINPTELKLPSCPWSSSPHSWTHLHIHISILWKIGRPRIPWWKVEWVNGVIFWQMSSCISWTSATFVSTWLHGSPTAAHLGNKTQ